MEKNNLLDNSIRKIKNFPKEGILFYDITSILQSPTAFNYCIDEMVELYKDAGIDSIACIEARGFLFAAPFALKMGLPLILIRKKGKLPGETIEKSFTLEYGEHTIHIHKADVKAGDTILVIDDLIATGGTAQASANLLEKLGGIVDEIAFVIDLPDLKGRDKLSKWNVFSLVEFEGE